MYLMGYELSFNFSNDVRPLVRVDLKGSLNGPVCFVKNRILRENLRFLKEKFKLASSFL